MESKLVITHDNSDLSVDEAVLSYQDISDGYVSALQDMQIKTADWPALLKDLSELCPGEIFDYGRSKNNIHYKINTEKFRGYIRGNSIDLYMSFYSKDEFISNQIWKLYLKYSEDDDGVTVFMTSFFMNGGQLDTNSKRVDHKELNAISEQYYPYINTQVMFDQFFTGAENILLLVGEPGLGKSKMSTLAMKHALNNSTKLPYDKLEDNPALENQFVNCAYVKSTDVLVNDKFWRDLGKMQADICIIDDLDYMLTKRDAEVTSGDDQNKNSFLNQFLSFTDGVEKTKTKFIITTNQKYNDIDTALLRKGRLFDILELRHLYNNEAKDIWVENKLDEKDFSKEFGDSHVLPADLGSEINKRKNDRIDSATKPYLKEEGISKVQNALRVKKIGL
jgi:DNA replication protein DnaC